ncbi:MAG: hypothetical protein ACYCYD_05555 [Acidimicrobiales bacterium]
MPGAEDTADRLYASEDALRDHASTSGALVDSPASARTRRGHREPARSTRPARPRRSGPVPAGQRRYMVLACNPDDTVAIDLATGAVARLQVPWPEGREPDLSSFDLIDIVPSPDSEPDDPAQPEAVGIASLPARAGSLRGRRARKLLRAVTAPGEKHLLGFPGGSAPYWEFRGMHPSVALLQPALGPLLFRRRDDSVWVRFGWPRVDLWLPVEDRRAIAALWAARRDRLAGKDLAGALGFKPSYVLVTLSKPRSGHCYKTVSALLPRS